MPTDRDINREDRDAGNEGPAVLHIGPNTHVEGPLFSFPGEAFTDNEKAMARLSLEILERRRASFMSLRDTVRARGRDLTPVDKSIDAIDREIRRRLGVQSQGFKIRIALPPIGQGKGYFREDEDTEEVPQTADTPAPVADTPAPVADTPAPVADTPAPDLDFKAGKRAAIELVIEEFGDRFRAKHRSDTAAKVARLSRSSLLDSAARLNEVSDAKQFFKLALLATLAVNGLAVAGYQAVTALGELESPSPIVALSPPSLTTTVQKPLSTEPVADSTRETAPANSSIQVAYDTVVQMTSEGADKDLRVAVANQWLVERHEIDAHDWTEIRQAHPWKEDRQALEALVGHLESWGGYKNPLLAYEAAKARGEAPHSISGLLFLVDNDPQLKKGTALRMAREIPLILDVRINPEDATVLAHHQTLNSYATQTVEAVQGAYEGGRLKRPAQIEYSVKELPDVSTKLEGLNDDGINDEEGFADRFDVPEPGHVKAMPAEQRAKIEMNLDWRSSLTQLAEKVEGSGDLLFKKARGASNRKKVRVLCSTFSQELKTLCASAEQMDADQLFAATMKLKANYFTQLSELTRVNGFYSEYLREFTQNTVMNGLASAVNRLPQKPGVEGVQEQTRAELLAAVPEGFFRA